ncbi:hypothetical protein KZ829_36250 [Actinoplanes hulinensis]|uniref:Twin-arginine translocation signal domain-containing protein n=1 Tax=Actinoplanes hulinensis TaxID=1144547 RepID=A0ABS7BE90_9ACTN|nr:hypothetical protein [Actinoplanes hulinensis]MBW6439192.1 hypothetical protein [Actinoplanes hulinensis]
MSTLLDRIPEIRIDLEAGGEGSSARPMATRPATTPVPDLKITVRGVGRRTFLRGAVAGGGALALSMLGWVAERVPAFAAKGDRTTLSPTHCISYDTPGGDIPCWGRDYIGSGYCGSDGRHRTDTVNSGSYSTLYSWDPACAGYAGWFWRTSAGTTNCWDGHYYTRTNATGKLNGPYTTICKKKVS